MTVKTSFAGVNYADVCVRWGLYESARKYVRERVRCVCGVCVVWCSVVRCVVYVCTCAGVRCACGVVYVVSSMAQQWQWQWQ